MYSEQGPLAEPDSLQVLVADDDPIFTALATSSLSRAGIEVHVARDGVEAIEALEQRVFDMALVDLSMPRVDGFRLIALIRSTPRLQKLPIIVLSSLNDANAVEEAYALGADAFLSKPVNWTLLPAHMRHVLRCSRHLAGLHVEISGLRRAAGQASIICQ